MPFFVSNFYCMKVFFRRIHLYLSFAAGLVILTCCLTGAMLVFEKDLQMAFNKNRYYVNETGKILSPGELVTNVKNVYPQAKINGIKLYTQPDRSAEINVGFPSGKKADVPAAAKPAKPERQPGFTIFVDPVSRMNRKIKVETPTMYLPIPLSLPSSHRCKANTL